MAESNFKEVQFQKYCKTCKYRKVKETEEPCNECLTQGARTGSHKPLKYDGNGSK